MEYGIDFDAKLSRNRRLTAGGHRYELRRQTGDANNVDMDLTFLYASFAHPLKHELERKLYLEAGYAWAEGDGESFSVGRNADFTQSGPYLALNYRFTRSPNGLRIVSLKLRHLRQNDRATPPMLGDFSATHVSLEGRVDF